MSLASGSVPEAWVALVRFSPRKSTMCRHRPSGEVQRGPRLDERAIDREVLIGEQALRTGLAHHPGKPHRPTLQLTEFASWLFSFRENSGAKRIGFSTRFRNGIGAGEIVPCERLSDISVELPRFDYRRRAGRRYRYVYGAGNAVPGDFEDNLVKLDLDRATASPWREEGCYPGEPVFVAAPQAPNEDDGVVLSVLSCLFLRKYQLRFANWTA